MYTSTLSSFRNALSQSQGGAKGYTDDNLLSAPALAPAPASIERPASTGGKKKKKKSQLPVNGELQSESQNEHSPERTESTPSSSGIEGDAMLLDRTVEGGLDGVMGLGSSREMHFSPLGSSI